VNAFCPSRTGMRIFSMAFTFHESSTCPTAIRIAFEPTSIAATFNIVQTELPIRFVIASWQSSYPLNSRFERWLVLPPQTCWIILLLGLVHLIGTDIVLDNVWAFALLSSCESSLLTASTISCSLFAGITVINLFRSGCVANSSARRPV
jgi:hypothetical protein